MQYQVSNIEWDFENELGIEEVDSDLPTECVITISDIELEDLSEDEISDIIGDRISDIYGFCHHGFKYEQID